MNYLAHLFLSGKNHGVILGSLLEDYVVGSVDNAKNQLLPEDVKTGLRLHRFIDTLTDTHEVVKECKQLFYLNFGKFSPVIVDVIFDHYLHKNWEVFSDEPFSDFKNRVYYSLTSQYQELHPPGLKKMVGSMTNHDWLKNYIHLWGVEKALSSLNGRVKELDLTEAIPIMEANYDFIDQHFLVFFKYLKDECEKEFF